MRTCSDRAESAAPQRYSLNGATMGSRYSAVFHAAPELDSAPLAQALYEAVDAVDRQMSSWKPDSDLMRLNALQPGEWMTLPADLAWVLQTAIQVGAESAGAFEIGVGELVDAWGFGPGHQPVGKPQREALRQGVSGSAGAALVFEFATHRVRKRHPVQLDLSGIAKGFGVDQLARCLERHGIQNYLVSIDGELRAAGSKPDGSAWTVAIEKPQAGVREAFSVIEMGDGALATSGDYRHFHELEGRRYAHTMDPLSGQPLDNPLASVSVLAPSCMLADAWATALLVLGPERGPALACERGMSALFLLRDGDAIRQLLILDGQPQD